MTEYDYQADEHRRKWVDRKLASILGDNDARYCELGGLLDDVTKAAAAQAVAEGHRHDDPAERYGPNLFDAMLAEAAAPIENLRWAFGDLNEEIGGRVWSHQQGVIADVKARRVPQFQRQEIEQVAGGYIAGRVKSAAADRLFVDVLVAMEFYQYADSVLNAPHIPILAPHIFKRKPMIEWFIGRLISIVSGMIGFGLFWLFTKIGFPESWLWIVGLILFGLFLMESVWSLIQLPRTWFAVRDAQKKITGIFDKMYGVYTALNSSGPISAQHVSDLVMKSTEAGVVWPGPLHVLLEDIIARGGRF